MDQMGPVTLLLIIANCAFSYLAFQNPRVKSRFVFRVGEILGGKDYIRMLSSGFLHANIGHLALNMIGMLFFGPILEAKMGIVGFLTVYFVALLAGNLFALFVHRNNYYYSALGASGAVMGVVFACIALIPGLEMGLLFIPFISMPSWLFGFLYTVMTIYGIRAQADNIGHEAHLGGGIFGMLIAMIFAPEALMTNTLAIVLILVPALAFLFLLIYRPEILRLPTNRRWQGGGTRNKTRVTDLYPKRNYQTKDDRYNERKAAEIRERDQLLEKVLAKGESGLTSQERERLDELSRKY